MKIVLTGGAGFIGSCMLWKLNELGYSDILVVDSPGDHEEKRDNLAKRQYAGILSKEAFLERMKTSRPDCDVLIHLGACTDTTERDTNYLTLNNFIYSQQCALWALNSGKRFLYASSASVYGDGKLGYKDNDSFLPHFKPLNAYAASKHQFDRWLLDEKMTDQVTGFRYFNVFGPNEYHKGEMRSLIHKAFGQIQSTGKVRLFATSRPGFGDGSETRDFVYVKDVVEVMAYFLAHPMKKGIFNVGTGKARSFKDLANAVFAAMGREPNIEYFPMPDSLKGQYQYFTQADLVKLRAAGCDHAFRSLEDSVKDYVQSHLVLPDPYL